MWIQALPADLALVVIAQVIPDQFDIQRVGTISVLVALLILVIRTAMTRKWVPGAYFEDMRTERDGARAELREAARLLKTSVDAHAQLQETHAIAVVTQSRLVEQNGYLLRDPRAPGSGAAHG